MWKWIRRLALLSAATAVLLAATAWWYVASLDLDEEPLADRNAVAADLEFLRPGSVRLRGRILAVVSSTARFDAQRRKAGYELTELSRAYWVFLANGYEVDIASPRGGEPPMVQDDDLVDADYAFLNDAAARAKLAATVPLEQVDPARYAAVYFVGGKGAMFDFPGNAQITRVLSEIAPRGVVGAVCHGPAALLDAVDTDGRALLAGRRVTAFSNAEELFLIDNARAVFPFLLQDALVARGAQFVEAPLYLENVVRDGNLVTGQNPWSTWAVAETMVRALGHEPVPRKETAEESSIRLLALHHREGLSAALEHKSQSPRSDKRLLLMHALIAAMRYEWRQAYALQHLARH